MASRVQVRAAPVTSGQAAEVKLLIAAEATVTDTHRKHIHGDVVLDIVGNIVEPASLAIAYALD